MIRVGNVVKKELGDVFVVMCNDFPDSIYASEESANAYVAFEKAKLADEAKRYPGMKQSPRHYRVYSFPVQE